MSIILPASAFFLPPAMSENNGVDFLGLRQANLDMMADLIPSINNVTTYIRPFSLLCWIFWKFHDLCVAKGIEQPSNTELKTFRERIEVLFTWGARIEDYPNIPGKLAAPPVGDGPVSLTFETWGRIQTSTSLVAALWYGPAAKAVIGLGFLSPIPRKAGFFRTVDRGIDLAKALDEVLRADADRYRNQLATLDSVTATEDDARALWALWSPAEHNAAEQAAFRRAFFDESAVGDYSTLIGRRSSTLALARLHYLHCASSATPEEVRRGMFLSQGDDGLYAVPDVLEPARMKWIALQMRQLQRYALEHLLSWCEEQVIKGENDTADLADAWLQSVRGSDCLYAEADTLGAAVAVLDTQITSLDAYLDQCRIGGDFDPFAILNRIRIAISSAGDDLAPLCLHALLLCCSFTRCLPEDTVFLRIGGPERLSFLHLRRRLDAVGDMPIAEALRFVMESLVLSQHFATAVNRFDGQNQRLRLTIEETGLCSLMGSPWVPSLTADRLATLLSLAKEAQIEAFTDKGG